eukprot:TRINITY_DN108059_c0_g1_i1.p1 TRINITY_DN108059_c0_g1~~TRINITY_DN108059_c0_g1_i1.p1  ORF type:complete len:730 (+),score=126.78 TRINITY_DN108059_c0_g1_i1:49-2238(+)
MMFQRPGHGRQQGRGPNPAGHSSGSEGKGGHMLAHSPNMSELSGSTMTVNAHAEMSSGVVTDSADSAEEASGSSFGVASTSHRNPHVFASIQAETAFDTHGGSAEEPLAEHPRQSLVEGLTGGMASLWSARSDASSQDSLQPTVLVGDDIEEMPHMDGSGRATQGNFEPDSDAEGLVDGAGYLHEALPSTAGARSSYFEGKAAELAETLRRFSGDLSSNVAAFRQATAAQVVTGQEDQSRGSSTSGAAGARLPSLDIDELVEVAHVPFRQLMQSVPDPVDTISQERAALASHPREDPEDRGRRTSCASRSAGSPLLTLFSAVVRARLSAHIFGCHEVISSDLSPEEARLWNIFVNADISLSGALRVTPDTADELGNAFAEVMGPALSAACLRALRERVDENNECDFADVLDVWTLENRPDHFWQLRSSLRSSVSSIANLLTGSNGVPSSREILPVLHARCEQLSDVALGNAASAYQRSLILTCSWRCEQRLLSFLLGSKDRPVQRRSDVAKLLAVLHGIHSELVPTECALWELFGLHDHNFDGAVSKDEVLGMLEDLLSFHQEAGGASSGELEELDMLRRQCQRRSVNNLFDRHRKAEVSFAGLLKWWWDMPEDYREASAISIPAFQLQQSQHRLPEEMFRGPLRAAASDPYFARQALRWHVRTFAELRALAVRRSIDGFVPRSATASLASTSEYGDTLTSSSRDRDLDGEDDADPGALADEPALTEEH